LSVHLSSCIRFAIDTCAIYYIVDHLPNRITMDSVFSHSISEHGTIAWDDAHMTIGSGFNLRKHQILRSPFAFYQPPTDDLTHPRNAHTIQISQQTFRDQDTLQHYLKSDTQMLASVFSAVSIKASVGCLKSARCSKTSMTVVKRCTITLPAEHFERDLGLTKEAEACFGTLNWYKGSNAQNFMDRYGQYCVTGYTRQSTFFAVSTYSADTKEQLDSFASGLSANFDGKKVAVQAASSFEMGSSKMSHNIRQTHEITVTGCRTESLEDRFHTVDLQRAWVDFLKFYSPIPYMAHVKHYSNLDVRLPHPQDLFSIPKTLRDAAQLAQLLTMSVQSNRLAGAQALAPALESAVSRLSDLQFWIEGCEDRLEQCLSDFNNIRETLMGVWHTRQALAGTLHRIVPWNDQWKL
jgi:hypothetical protein